MYLSLSTQTDTVGLSRESIFSAQYTVWYPSHHVLLNPLIIYWQGGECNSTLREASQIKSHQSDFCCVTADHSREASHFPSLDAWAGSVMRCVEISVSHCALIPPKNISSARSKGKEVGSESFMVTFQLDPQIPKEWEWFRTLIWVVGVESAGLLRSILLNYNNKCWIFFGCSHLSAHSRSSNASEW